MKKLIKRYFPTFVVISRPIRALTKKLIVFVINSIILIFSLFILKSKKITVVGGWFGERFADNSKYFFLYLNENLIDSGFSKVVLITRSNTIIKELSEEGYLVYSTWSFPSVWYHLRAKYHFIDHSPNDINPFFSVRSKRINFWHGFPLKKIGSFSGFKQLSSNNKIQKLILKLTTVGFWADYYLLATSEFSAEILGSAFGVDDKKIIISGYPRNYESISDNSIRFVSEHEKEIYDAIKECKTRGHKIIGYFPTFRDKKETLLFGTECIEDIDRFLDYCDSVKIKFLTKFHFAGKNDKFGELENHNAIISLPSEADVYTYLNLLDILMTDYSSLYFDFLLWNRPILFFPYDLEYYRDEDRGLIFDYEEFTPGPKAYGIEDLQIFYSENINIINVRYEEKFRLKADLLKEKIFGDYKNMRFEHLLNKLRNICL